MSKIYVVDYGISVCKATNDTINKLFEENSWKCTGFNTTYWKDIEGQCNIEGEEKNLRELIQNKIGNNCIVTLLVMCVDKSDVIGKKNGNTIFGSTNFLYPDKNNLA